jgi:hypothetical protein
MHPSQRVITAIPLVELWNDQGVIESHRVGFLDQHSLRNLLRRGSVRFVVADVGEKPVWIAEDTCYGFWKSEVQQHLADPEKPVVLDSYPNSYCFNASEWSVVEGTPIVLLEKNH